MSAVSLFTPVYFTAPKSCTEKTLSAISKYFFLGGPQAHVIKGNEVRLENANISWYTAALKVTSYILFFPLTITLFAVNLHLRSLHTFTVIPSTQQMQEPKKIDDICNPVTPSEQVPSLKPKPLTEQVETQDVAGPKQDLNEQSDKVLKTAQAVQKVCKKVVQSHTFQPFTVHISTGVFSIKESEIIITSLKELNQKVREIAQKASDEHIHLGLNVPIHGPERAQTEKFIQRLQKYAVVTATRYPSFFIITPCKTTTTKDGCSIHKYKNGIIEEVVETINDEGVWKGRRIYPNGATEEGIFRRLHLNKGTRIDNKVIAYRHPDRLIHHFGIDKGLIYADLDGEKRLIGIQRNPDAEDDSFEYIQADEDPISVLTQILKAHDTNFRISELENVLSGPINSREFIDFLFKTNEIFSLELWPFKTVLKIIQKEKLSVNLQLQHPETKETLFEKYSRDKETLQALLEIEPKLIQRKKGKETAFVRALLQKNKKGAIFLLEAMQKEHIKLLDRERLFKKVVFSEGEVTLQELKKLSSDDKKIVYRLANMYSRLPVVQLMRELGFKRDAELLVKEGPSIFGYNMDALEMHECLQSFLKNLRAQKKLFTPAEFAHLQSDNYIEKGSDVGRILGRDYIERKALELGLKHVKVPKKIVVVDDSSDIKFRIGANLSILAPSSGVQVYAERIEQSFRNVTAEEVSELLTLFEATGYSDIHWGNIIVAKDGVYIIDTEFVNFWVLRYYFTNGRQYAEMAKIVHALAEVDQKPFIDLLNAKRKAYLQEEEKITEKLTLASKAGDTALENTGCRYAPSFTFSVKKL